MALATTENILPHWTTVSSGELELITWPKMLTKLLQTETAEDSQKIILSKENNCKHSVIKKNLLLFITTVLLYNQHLEMF